MTTTLPTTSYTVLIADPDQNRFDCLQKVLLTEFDASACRVTAFQDLRQAALHQDPWRIILIADTLPDSPERHGILLLRYFAELGQNWRNRLGCIVTTDHLPDLTGISPTPVYLHLKSSCARQAATAEHHRLVAELKQFGKAITNIRPNQAGKHKAAKFSAFSCQLRLESDLVAAQLSR